MGSKYLLQNFGEEVRGEELHDILREIDTNMNGQVELDEYLQVLSTCEMVALCVVPSKNSCTRAFHSRKSRYSLSELHAFLSFLLPALLISNQHHKSSSFAVCVLISFARFSPRLNELKVKFSCE